MEKKKRKKKESANKKKKKMVKVKRGGSNQTERLNFEEVRDKIVNENNRVNTTTNMNTEEAVVIDDPITTAQKNKSRFIDVPDVSFSNNNEDMPVFEEPRRPVRVKSSNTRPSQQIEEPERPKPMTRQERRRQERINARQKKSAVPPKESDSEERETKRSDKKSTYMWLVGLGVGLAAIYGVSSGGSNPKINNDYI